MGVSKDEVLKYLKEARDRFAREYGVRRIGLFGSTARDAPRKSSDVDLLVEMEAPTFDHYMDLKFEIEDHFGVSVDLVLSDTVKKRLRPAIERETIYA